MKDDEQYKVYFGAKWYTQEILFERTRLLNKPNLLSLQGNDKLHGQKTVKKKIVNL